MFYTKILLWNVIKISKNTCLLYTIRGKTLKFLIKQAMFIWITTLNYNLTLKEKNVLWNIILASKSYSDNWKKIFIIRNVGSTNGNPN